MIFRFGRLAFAPNGFERPYVKWFFVLDVLVVETCSKTAPELIQKFMSDVQKNVQNEKSLNIWALKTIWSKSVNRSRSGLGPERISFSAVTGDSVFGVLRFFVVSFFSEFRFQRSQGTVILKTLQRKKWKTLKSSAKKKNFTFLTFYVFYVLFTFFLRFFYKKT